MKFKLKENNIQNILFGNVLSEKDTPKVLFFDYDGTLLYSYTKKEFLKVTALPQLPNRTNENLTCDGWNWTLSDIMGYLNFVDGDVNVGAIYHTTDNKTHFTCIPTETYPSAKICLTPTVANDVVVDWGDGTTDTWTATTANVTKTHNYTNVTDSSVYDITISCTTGTYSFPTYISGGNQNRYFNYTDIKLSNKVTSLGNNLFYYSCYFKTINVPNSVTSFGEYTFRTCNSLKFISIPRGITSLKQYCFNACYSLQNVSIPNTVTNFGYMCFASCSSLKTITIPSNITTFGSTCFNSCSSIESITIPNGISNLSENCFRYCYSLKNVNIPNSVTSIGNACFESCYSLQCAIIPKNVTSLRSGFFNAYSLNKLYMKPTTPPTICATTHIGNNPSLVIYVPRGYLSTYQSATNWSSHASKMVEYDY